MQKQFGAVLDCKNEGLKALIGTTVKDRYSIEKALTRGSYGCIFLVWDKVDER